MHKIRRILFPVDLSRQCRAIVPHVREMARSFQAELVVINALETPPRDYKHWNAYLTLVNWDTIRKERQRQLAAFVREAFEQRSVTCLMEEGDPARTIVNYSREHQIDLVMIPTHGYGPFRSLLIGSVTAKVLHDTEVPVWTSAHVPEPDPTAAAKFRRILCAVDITEASIPAIQWAAEFARHFRSSLHLVHAVGAAGAVNPSFQSFLLSTARNGLAKLQQIAGVDAPAYVAGGAVAEVIGRGHSRETLGRLRTNAYAVIRQSPCPVISV